MLTRLLAGITVVMLCFTFGVRASADEKPPTLTDDDKKYLDGLMKEFLFDPKGAERVTVNVTVRNVWLGSEKKQTEGWHIAGKDGKPGRIYFIDGASITAPPEKEIKKVDFKAACKTRYAAKPKKDDDHEDRFHRMRESAIGTVQDDDLALAAWLYRLGDEETAVIALEAARKEKGDPRARLRAELTWSAYAGMVHAYMARADEEALNHGERLLRLYSDEVKSDKRSTFEQAPRIVEELKRRQKKGTFGKTPPKKWPDGFDKWDVKKKTAYLIDALEEVDVRQSGQPGGVNLASDRRVEELIRLGEAAVPSLIDAMENDERLTRSVHFWRDFARSRTVLGVREAELTALMSILRVQVFEPASTGDNFTARGTEQAISTAQRLRAYWKEYGNLPFDERMMKVLTDPKTKFEAKREAAENLATLDADRRIGTMVWTSRTSDPVVEKPNPAIAKFNKPTVAEAILTAMDADLKANMDEAQGGQADYHRRLIERTYIPALVDLGDKRIAPELAKRAVDAKKLHDRLNWAQAAHFLGEPKALQSLADDFRLGKLEELAKKSDESEFYNVFRALIGVKTTEADRALDALADPKHPLHDAFTKKILTEEPDRMDETAWFFHPICLSVLRKSLDDESLTGTHYSAENGRLNSKSEHSSGSGNLPDCLTDPQNRLDAADERVCDAAATKLEKLVVGLPVYHPLLKDSEKRLTEIKSTLDRFAGKYRRATPPERHVLDLWYSQPGYLPDIRPLGRPATAKDVRTGNALFFLPGKSKPADLTLPAAAVLKSDEMNKRPKQGIILQAEVDSDGKKTYGVIMRDGIRTMSETELSGIKSFAEVEKEEKAAEEKRRKAEKEEQE